MILDPLILYSCRVGITAYILKPNDYMNVSCREDGGTDSLLVHSLQKREKKKIKRDNIYVDQLMCPRLVNV
jgi:hypothetical protein